jgi:hypothetical protein
MVDLLPRLSSLDSVEVWFWSIVKMATAAERLSDGASEEKKIGNDHVEHGGHTIENLPDPDAGLSEEERAVQVRLLASRV